MNIYIYINHPNIKIHPKAFKDYILFIRKILMITNNKN